MILDPSMIVKFLRPLTRDWNKARSMEALGFRALAQAWLDNAEKDCTFANEQELAKMQQAVGLFANVRGALSLIIR